jgi:hypothetical protein
MSSFSCTPRPLCLRSRPQEASPEGRIVLAAGWSIGAGCPSFGGQRTALLHRRKHAFQESRWLASPVWRSLPLGLLAFQAVAFHVPPGTARLPSGAKRAKNSEAACLLPQRKCPDSRCLTTNTNAKSKYSIPASFAVRCLGHSGRCHTGAPSAA